MSASSPSCGRAIVEDVREDRPVAVEVVQVDAASVFVIHPWEFSVSGVPAV